MFGEFKEAGKLKTALVKYSVEFIDFAVQTRPHRIVLVAGQILHITVCEKVCWQTSAPLDFVWLSLVDLCLYT